MQIIKLPDGAKRILEVLQSFGQEAFVVGGCVRDSLLGKTPHDWDICTSASPDEVCLYFKNEKVVKTGIKHGTVSVILHDGVYEVTTYRVDGKYSDHRRPDSVIFTKSLPEDLSRRDFTINAMAFKEDCLVDLFGGEEDLKNKIISCVGDPDARFNEDALRMLRAMRFASVYGFSIAECTADSIHRNKYLLRHIAAERIQVELCKLLSGEGVLDILLEFSDVISTIIPEISPCIGFDQNNRFHRYTVYDHIAHAVSNYHGKDNVVNMALLLHDIGKPKCYSEDEKGGHFYGHSAPSHDISVDVLSRLRFDTKSKNNIAELVLYHDSAIEPTERVARKWLNKIGEEQLLRLLDLKMADILSHAKDTQEERIKKIELLRGIIEAVIQKEQCFQLRDMNISGNDILSLGVPEGRLVGNTLSYLLDLVISGTLPNDHIALMEEALNYIRLNGVVEND